MGMLNLFREGGFVMYPLLICSLAIWAVVFEKYYSIFKFTKEYKSLYGLAHPLIRDGKIDEAKGLYSQADGLVGRPYLTLFDGIKASKELREEQVSRRLVETQLGLKRFMWVLGTIGSSAPFVGLFGTVVGIIRSFESIAEAGKSGFSVVAAGLSEALIASAAGILVAIVAVVFYNYFQTRLSKINLEYKNTLEDLADYL